MKKIRYALLEAPISRGSPTAGSEGAYTVLTERGLGEILGEDTLLCPMEGLRLTDALCREDMKYADDVMTVSRRLSEKVAKVLAEGYFPVTVGGDHSIVMGDLCGMSSRYSPDELALLYIDGHTDINTEKTTVTGFIHGMPVASALGLCSPCITVGEGAHIRGENVFILGARSIDPGEYAVMEENGICLCTAETLREKGCRAVLDGVLAALGDRPVYVSFDVDFLDGDIFSSTGYRMRDGMDKASLEYILKEIFTKAHPVGFDCVEYNPVLDREGKDGRYLLGLFEKIAAWNQPKGEKE